MAENIPARLYGDEIRIRQSAVNILTNAVKYSNGMPKKSHIHIAMQHCFRI